MPQTLFRAPRSSWIHSPSRPTQLLLPGGCSVAPESHREYAWLLSASAALPREAVPVTPPAPTRSRPQTSDLPAPGWVPGSVVGGSTTGSVPPTPASTRSSKIDQPYFVPRAMPFSRTYLPVTGANVCVTVAGNCVSDWSRTCFAVD